MGHFSGPPCSAPLNEVTRLIYVKICFMLVLLFRITAHYRATAQDCCCTHAYTFINIIYVNDPEIIRRNGSKTLGRP